MNATGGNLSLGAFVLCVACGVCTAQSTTDWPVYNGALDGDHYSRLGQINRTNVHRLKVAWSFDTGEEGVIEFNPLIVGRVLYAYTQSQKVVALDAATGKLKWNFDSGVRGTQQIGRGSHRVQSADRGPRALRIHAIAEGGRAGRRYGEAQVEFRLGRSGHATDRKRESSSSIR